MFEPILLGGPEAPTKKKELSDFRILGMQKSENSDGSASYLYIYILCMLG